MTMRNVVAVWFIVLLLGSPFGSAVAAADTVQGGTVNVSTVGNAPAITVPDATLDGNGGDIEVGYNATGEIDPGDVTIRLSGPFDQPLEKTGVESEEGKVTFSLPDRSAIGGYRIEAELIDESASDWNQRFRASDSAVISVQSSVSITDVAVANTAAGNDEVFEGETFTMEATLDNEGQSEQDVSLSAYVGVGATPNGETTATVAGNDQTVVAFPVTVPAYYGLSDGESIQSSLAVNDLGSQGLVVNGPPTVSVSGSGVSVDSTGDVYPGDQVPVTATVTNDESRYGTATVELEKDGESTGNMVPVYLPADGSDTATFYTSFETAGEHTVSVAGNSATVTVAEPVAEVTAVEHLGGTEPAETITTDHVNVIPPSGDGGLLQVDIEDSSSSHPQDLGGLGVDESTRFRVTVKIGDSYSPDALIATAQNASWTVTDVSDGYEVTVEAQPLEAQYIAPSPEHGSWPSGEDDQATTSYDPMFSLAFHEFESDDVARNVSGTILATDAQRFGSPLYYKPAPDEDPVLELSVAGPHYTVSGDENRGQYEAFLPETLLESWGVTGPDELGAAYQGENLELNAEETDGGIYVSVPIHYSSGTVQVSRSESSGGSSPSGSTSGSSDPVTTTTEITTTTETTTTMETTTTETTTKTATETTTDVETTTREATTEPARTNESSDVPGFGVEVALVALAGASLLAGRRGC